MHFQRYKTVIAAMVVVFMACNRSAQDQRVDFTVDMTQVPYDNLNNTGGYTYATSPNGVNVILIHDYYGKYYALSEYCTYDLTILSYLATPSQLYCTNDQSHFNTDGSVVMGPAHTPLKTYYTEVNGNYLRIYSTQ